jgi:SatD family protein
MPAAKPPTFAILMGDIVGSERAPSLKAVHIAFNKVVRKANDVHAEHIASPLTITLGDEFQGLLTAFAHAWDTAVALRLELLVAGISCRFVVGVAELETPLNRKEAWNMMGSGLSAARDKLNDKRTKSAYRFSLPAEPVVALLLDTVGDALTQGEEEWTPTQLEYYSKSRAAKGTNAAVAMKLGVSERSLYKVLKAGRADAHKRQVQAIRSALAQLDQRYFG